MADIDMIPRSYRQALAARRTLACYGVALALLAAGGAAAGQLLRWRVAAATPALERLREASTRAGALRTQLGAAGQRRDALAQDARALAALRGLGDAGTVAAALDAALNDKVWLERLAFTRTQEPLAGTVPQPPPPGTVLAPGKDGMQAWRLARYVELKARAQDQAAMASFIAALAASPLLADVRFLNSEAGADGDAALSFGVSGALRPAAGSTP